MSRLITIAAWIAAIATVLWQRALKPYLQDAFPEFFAELAAAPLAAAPAAPLTPEPAAAVVPASEPAPTPRRTRNRRASGFAAA